MTTNNKRTEAFLMKNPLGKHGGGAKVLKATDCARSYWQSEVINALNRCEVNKTVFDKPVRVRIGWPERWYWPEHERVAAMIIKSLVGWLLPDADTEKIELWHHWTNGGSVIVKVEEI